ncbi:hypothetical protein BEP19_15045 [Ammoniphilus oxalaticus]|uniref:Uncharacterized protein n=1 Tax=Ammoniphilus oxalaticus TaxID=66863 RepID=A0A419SDH3_9BACL|nr:hypothetical protein [Ammoniphilus oxalaticus]RKD20997.1 hypothetical protein BEP19_15045 [Ammoniphilus oxalaticus]
MRKSYGNEELEEGFRIFFKPYLEGYRERVNTLYPDEHADSDIFTYMKPVHLHVLLHDSDTHLLFARDEEDGLTFIDCMAIDEDEFDHISSSSDKLMNKFVYSVSGLNDYLTVFHFSRLGEYAGISFSESNRGTLVGSARKWGVEKADDHYSAYKFSKALERAISPSIELATINTDEVLERVQDPSFQYEFGESAKAYNAGLYLAAASTAGIALENILRLIITKVFGRDKLPSKSYIIDSLLVLDRKKVLPGRLRNEVWAQNGIRNSNAHTNEDPVKKETVETLYRLINELSFFIT